MARLWAFFDGIPSDALRDLIAEAVCLNAAEQSSGVGEPVAGQIDDPDTLPC
jgi:hypothetical protein